MSEFINSSQTYDEAILEAERNIVDPLENTEGLTDKGLIRVLRIELNKALTEVRDTLREHNKLLEEHITLSKEFIELSEAHIVMAEKIAIADAKVKLEKHGASW